MPYDTVMNETEFKMYLNRLNDLGVRQSVHLSEACAIAYYQQQTEFPIIKTLLADPPRQNSCRLKFLNKIKFEIRNENLYKAFRRL